MLVLPSDKTNFILFPQMMQSIMLYPLLIISVKEMIMRLLQNYGTIVYAIFRGGGLNVSLKKIYSTPWFFMMKNA